MSKPMGRADRGKAARLSIFAATAGLLAILISFASGQIAPADTPHPADQLFSRSLPHLATYGDDILVQFKSGTSEAEKTRVQDLIQTGMAKSLSNLQKDEDVLKIGVPAPTSINDIFTPFGKSSPVRYMAYARAADADRSALWTLPDKAVLSILEVVRKQASVSIAQPNYHYRLSADTPNDDLYRQGKLWNIYGDPPLGPAKSPFGTGVEKAWANSHTGSEEVYVAVLDSGVDATHSDLAANLDMADARDYIRDPKYNSTIDKDAAATAAFLINVDEVGHGTHVAGIIGAVGNNQIAVAGVNWKVRIIPMKVAGGDGLVETSLAATALNDLVKMKKSGKNIIAANLSWDAYAEMNANGDPELDSLLFQAIKDAGSAGILSIAAAMNDSNNNDLRPAYPASFDTRQADTSGNETKPGISYDSVISVAAIDSSGKLYPKSNFGEKTVHIGAPGVHIISTVPKDNSYFLDLKYEQITSRDGSYYAYLDGTSMAAPHVTGGAALYLAYHNGATAQQVRDAILKSAKLTPSLAGKVLTGGRLDLSGF